MADSGGSNLKSVLSGGMGSRLVISDHGQEAELLSRHLMYLCSHSMPHVRAVLLGTVSAAIRHQGPPWLAAVSSASVWLWPASGSQPVDQGGSCRLPARVEASLRSRML